MIETQDLPALASALVQTARVPSATYRLQFNASFTFRAAARLVPYLHALGISDLYASPYLKARFGSPHGYDVADPNALNPELGTEQDYAELLAALAAREMGQVLDFVPNHMGIGDVRNTWWFDVLENGPSSLYASFFDIDWTPLKPDVQDRYKVVLPILGDQYGRVLEQGELRLSYRDGAFFLHCYDRLLPLEPKSWVSLLQQRLDELETELGSDSEALLELQSIITALTNLPPRAVLDPRRMRERNREKEIIKRRLARLTEDCPPVRAAIEATLRLYNGTPGDPRSFDRLDALLGEQAYRLAFWRVAAEEINYRRFFDINELAAIRVEDPRVFRQTHRLLLELVQRRALTGLRIDHPDGLLDPAGYFWRLQQHCYARLRLGAASPDGPERASMPDKEQALIERVQQLRAQDPASPALRPMYLVVEKVLVGDERLNASWPVHGTTGYDFLNVLNGIFVNRDHRAAFDALYARVIGGPVRFEDVANSAKKMVMLISLAAEVNQLGYQLKRIASRSRLYRDFTLNSLTFVIREIIASMPVYRTYVDPFTGALSDADRAVIEAAVVDARRRNPRTDPSIFDFVRRALLLELAEPEADEERAELLRFVGRFQQTSGPVMAKGVEDTAFYRYNRLVSLNEVGGNPGQFGTSVAAFHRFMLERARHWPASLSATSTHDTKRSEDVRARINVLSELPREWSAALTRWSRLNARKRTLVDGRPAPDRNDEYLLYQTLLGTWPLGPLDEAEPGAFTERIVAYMLKALKEAKVHTSWINANAPYEEAMRHFVEAILDRSGPNPFLDDFQALAAKVAQLGMFNSLSQTLLKLAAPGVPDLYQGTELWDFSLVDPDNRRPVDFARRIQALQTLQCPESERARLAEELLQTREDGRIKLYVIQQSLLLRRQCPELFQAGAYVPLRASGPARQHVCAFARVVGGQSVVAVAPVLVAGLLRGAATSPIGEAVWNDTWLRLPGGGTDTYRNCFTGELVQAGTRAGRAGLALKEVLARFPVALLERVEPRSAGG